ncbi:helix-turn-helix domain-containing protein [Lentzea cavernae]|uniref:Transcriptional regulator n=1 Tax=Lentzea cavernae TaxID=2020703 RepID=A0ABQ3MDY8_9PSEU|nr:helix-turn-helix transcriptional regulator [Lentzea cavernae]GHH41736.1 transcriptional regulator [Lentzea cavernae]
MTSNLHDEVRDFLTSRRARTTPDDVGLLHAGSRRVPGLRREEVAALAGVSVEYYKRLERGNLRGVSDSVLDALARALRLDEAERTHLRNFARAAGRSSAERDQPVVRTVRPALVRLLESMTGTAAGVLNDRLDVLAANSLGRALYSDVFGDPARSNLARYTFLDSRSTRFYPRWEAMADETVAILRTAVSKNPDDRELGELTAELSASSEHFRTRWAAHDVRFHRTGVKDLHHPVVGDLVLSYEAMDLPSDPGLTLLAYTAEAGSRAEDSLRMLGSHAAKAAHEGR